MSNHRFIKALLKQPVDKTPIWIMRQAGRYLPEYRALREKAGSFMALCKTPELACEVTHMPLKRFDLDAAILFSDILTIPDAMGLGLHFVEGEGPQFDKPIKTASDIENLIIPHPEKELSYVIDAVSMISQSLQGKTPLIGFSGSPWTLACYMVEGQSSKDFRNIQTLMYQQPQLLHQMLEKLTKSIILYLNAQIESGVDAIQLFDTWGGILPKKQYMEFSLPYMQQICDALIDKKQGQIIPRIVFTKNGGQWLEEIANINCHAVGLDWTSTLSDAKARIGDKVALQGNLNPMLMLQTPEIVEKEATSVLKSFNGKTGHVFNLGHGITPQANIENVEALIKTVHNFSI